MDYYNYNVGFAAEIIRILCERRGMSGDEATELVRTYFIKKLYDPYFTEREKKRLLRIARHCESYIEWVECGYRQDRVRARFNLIVKLGKENSLYQRVSRHLDSHWDAVDRMMLLDMCYSDLPLDDHNDLLEFAAELRRVVPLLPARQVRRKSIDPFIQEARTLWARGLDLPSNESDIVRKLKQHGVSGAVAKHTAYEYMLNKEATWYDYGLRKERTWRFSEYE